MTSVTDLFNVSGLVAVITGGGTGIGLQVANALDSNGAKAVYIVGRREQKLREAAENAPNGSLIPLVGDVTDEQHLDNMAARVKREQGYVNFVWANAGVTGPLLHAALPTDRHPTVAEFRDAAFEKVSMDQYNKTFAANTTAPFYSTLAFLELLNEGNKRADVCQKSQVIVTASIGAFNRSPQDGWAYQTSKAAAVHLVKMMSTYFAPWKIRANCLAPGLFPTEMTDGILDFLKSGDGRAITEEGGVPENVIPLGRSGNNHDVAGTLMFLVSKAGAYLNGATIIVDGGRIGQVPATF